MPNVMLGMYIVCGCFKSCHRCLENSLGNRLLFAKLSLFCLSTNPFGAGHIRRVQCACEQSLRSRLLGIGSKPDVRGTRLSPIFVTDSMWGVLPSGSKM